MRLFQNCNEILPFQLYLNPCVHIKSLYQFTLLMKVFEGNAMDTCLSPLIPMSYYINKFIMYQIRFLCVKSVYPIVCWF